MLQHLMNMKSQIFTRLSPVASKMFGLHIGFRDYTHMSSKEVRQTFLEFFQNKNHKYYPSSSIIPKKDEGSYFVNAGMNQFKPIFLGSVEPTSEMAALKRAVNSQKCIRIGGKHNDLDDVGKDTSHHTFFEMLGSWSFGDYFKDDACKMAFELLTKDFGLPVESLYFTYFGGDATLQLPPDVECRDIWKKIGISNKRILPFGMKDNFWSMADTGPCGPCTEIHFDHLGREDAAHFVNAGLADLVELWNLVFMQYNRHEDGRLEALPLKHVDTGMGLERMTAVMQGKRSNYATDLFQPIIQHLQSVSNVIPYEEKYDSDDSSGVHTAYRTVADHVRMISVALSDGLLPGRQDSNLKLRQVVYKCLQLCHNVLQVPAGTTASLVPLVVDSLGDTYPKLITYRHQIVELLQHYEDSYFKQLEEGKTIIKKAVKEFNLSPGDRVAGQQLMKICKGDFGEQLVTEIAVELLCNRGYRVDLESFEELSKKAILQAKTTTAIKKSQSFKLSEADLTYLKSEVPVTEDDLKFHTVFDEKRGFYSMGPVETEVLALKCDDRWKNLLEEGDEGAIICAQSCFYSDSGGQVADVGEIISSDNEAKFLVQDVQKLSGYVVHYGNMQQGSLSLQDTVKLKIEELHRHNCMLNHTATHLLSFALHQVLGSCRQTSSIVAPDRLVFEFATFKPVVTVADVTRAVQQVNKLIHDDLDVTAVELSFEQVKTTEGISYLEHAVYPSVVRVLAVGTTPQATTSCKGHSVELCGGTHVSKTSHIGTLQVTNFQHTAQGTHRVTALTGEAAANAIKDGDLLKQLLTEVEQSLQGGATKKETVLKKIEQLEKALGSVVIPRSVRDFISSSLNDLNRSSKVQKRKSAKQALQENIENLMAENSEKDLLFGKLEASQNRDVTSVISALQPCQTCCLMYQNAQNKQQISVLLYVPSDVKQTAVSTLSEKISEHFGKQRTIISSPSMQSAVYNNVRIVNINKDKNRRVELNSLVPLVKACM